MAQAKIRIIPGRKSGLASSPCFNAAQATAATFIQGAPVKLTSGVLAAVSVTGSQGTSSGLSVVNKSSTSNIIGISEGKAAASSSNALVVRKFQEGQTFEGNLIRGVTASSAKLAASSLGAAVVLAKQDSDTHWGFAVDASSTFSSYASLVKGKVVQFIDDASTANGRVLVAITKGGALHA